MNAPEAPPALLEKARQLLAQHLLDDDSAQAPPSPCVSVCRMNVARSHCVGCLRTLDELRQWGGADVQQQRQIWREVLARCGMEVPRCSSSASCKQ